MQKILESEGEGEEDVEARVRVVVALWCGLSEPSQGAEDVYIRGAAVVIGDRIRVYLLIR